MRKNPEKDCKNDRNIVGDEIPIPHLSHGDYAWSKKEESIEWVEGLMNFYKRGDFHSEANGGVMFQIVSKDTLRCVRVYENSEVLNVLAMIKVTCETAGIRLLLDGALLTPVEEVGTPDTHFDSSESNESTNTPIVPPNGVVMRAANDNIGMEVV